LLLPNARNDADAAEELAQVLLRYTGLEV
jgi:hypothetical protein